METIRGGISRSIIGWRLGDTFFGLDGWGWAGGNNVSLNDAQATKLGAMTTEERETALTVLLLGGEI